MNERIDALMRAYDGAVPGAALLVVQDGRNLMPAMRQNFKYVSWQDVLEALGEKR